MNQFLFPDTGDGIIIIITDSINRIDWFAIDAQEK